MVWPLNQIVLLGNYPFTNNHHSIQILYIMRIDKNCLEKYGCVNSKDKSQFLDMDDKYMEGRHNICVRLNGQLSVFF